ncbi:hypothetical protein AHF37_09727 [Paragonimus kellicotti]|nr:hypothetical protein AHF37_09727 [Paragonimus kellicotti]
MTDCEQHNKHWLARLDSGFPPVLQGFTYQSISEGFALRTESEPGLRKRQSYSYKQCYVQVFWYRDNLPVHVPPFQVYNELVASHGIALLEIRAYPALFQQNSPKGEYSTSNSPVERITCVVTSQVKDKPVYKVTTNASLDIEVILIPRIINKTLLFAERNVDDAVKLTCVTIANGPPEMLFEFSSTSRSSQGLPAYTIPEWTAIQPRYGLNLRRIQPDDGNPTLHKLILDNSGRPLILFVS